MADGRTRKVVVFGSACVDLLMQPERLPRPGVTVLAPTYQLLPGGKGANQAHACAMASSEKDTSAHAHEKKKNVQTEFVGAVGADAFGEQLRRAFLDAGVGVDGLETHPSLPTACAAVIVDESGENQIAVGSGANGAAVASRLKARNGAFELNPGDVLLQQMEISKPEVFSAVAIAHEAGALSVLNVAPSAPVPNETLEKLDFLVANEHEAADVFENLVAARDDGALLSPTPARFDRTTDDAVGRSLAIASMTGVAVIVTLGAEGAVACLPRTPTRNGGEKQPRDTTQSQKTAEKVAHLIRVADVKNVLIGDETIVDTTGAGDAFCGAFCASLAAGHALTVCLQRASVAGTLGCTKVGARAGAPRSDEIAARAAKVAVAADFGDDVDDETAAAWLAAPAAAWTRRGY